MPNIKTNERELASTSNEIGIKIKRATKDLEQNAHKKLHDWNLAEKMAKEILDEWG